MIATQTPLNDARLTDRLQAQLDAVEQTINSGGRDEFDPRDLPFVLRDAIEALAARSVPQRIEVDIGAAVKALEASPELAQQMNELLGIEPARAAEGVATVRVDEMIATIRGVIEEARTAASELGITHMKIERFNKVLEALIDDVRDLALAASTEHAGAAEVVAETTEFLTGDRLLELLSGFAGLEYLAASDRLDAPETLALVKEALYRRQIALATHPVTVAEGESSVDDIAEVLFHQRQTGYRWSDALLSEPESDPGTLVSICRDDAEAVLALYRASPIQSEVGKP